MRHTKQVAFMKTRMHSYKILFEKSGPLGRSRRRWKDNIKV